MGTTVAVFGNDPCHNAYERARMGWLFPFGYHGSRAEAEFIRD